MHMLHRICIH